MTAPASMDTLPDDVLDAVLANEAAPGAPPEDLEGLVTRTLDARAMVEGLEEALKAARREYDDLRKRRLPERMQELGLVGPDGRGGFTHASGARVHLRVEVWAHIKKDDQEAAHAWLKEHGHGGIIKETIHPQTLRAFVRERLEDGEVIPPGVSTTVETVAVLVRPKEGQQS